MAGSADCDLFGISLASKANAIDLHFISIVFVGDRLDCFYETFDLRVVCCMCVNLLVFEVMFWG